MLQKLHIVTWGQRRIQDSGNGDLEVQPPKFLNHALKPSQMWKNALLGKFYNVFRQISSIIYEKSGGPDPHFPHWLRHCVGKSCFISIDRLLFSSREWSVSDGIMPFWHNHRHPQETLDSMGKWQPLWKKCTQNWKMLPTSLADSWTECLPWKCYNECLWV